MLALHSCIVFSNGRFYIDRTGNGNGTSYVVSDEDKARVNIRSQRFARGSEGNHVFKPKMSIEQLMKTVVSNGYHVYSNQLIIQYQVDCYNYLYNIIISTCIHIVIVYTCVSNLAYMYMC